MRVCPSMIYREAASGVMVWPPIVRIEATVGEARGMILLSITRASGEGERERTVPETVIAGAPGMSVWLPMTYAEALFGIIVLPAIVRAGAVGVGAAESGIVAPPLTTLDADGGRLMGVPDIVMAGAPGLSV